MAVSESDDGLVNHGRNLCPVADRLDMMIPMLGRGLHQCRGWPGICWLSNINENKIA